MYTTNNLLADKESLDLSINRLIKSDTYEVLSINLKAGKLFPEHITKKDAHMLMLKGRVQLEIAEENHYLVSQDVVEIPQNLRHSVRAIDDSHFLIIR